MSSIDEDAIDVIGIDPKIWKEFRMKNWKEERGKQYRELPLEREMPLDRELPKRGMVQPFLDGFLEAEARAREASIPSRAIMDRRRTLALRWFKYYRMSKNPKNAQNIIQQYNRICTMRTKG